MKRRLIHIPAFLSLLLCVASGALWVRSLSVRDRLVWAGPARAWVLESDAGRVEYFVSRHLRQTTGWWSTPRGDDAPAGWGAWNDFSVSGDHLALVLATAAVPLSRFVLAPLRRRRRPVTDGPEGPSHPARRALAAVGGVAMCLLGMTIAYDKGIHHTTWLLLVSAVPAVALLGLRDLLKLVVRHWPWETAEQRWRMGRCVSCGYDLTGNVSGVCPECGSAAGTGDGAEFS